MLAAKETLAAQGSTAETGVFVFLFFNGKNMLESAANTHGGSNVL